MYNFIPKRNPSVSLLYGKRSLQRIEVGHKKNHVEIPLPVVEKIYDNIDETRAYHNNDYNPLKWDTFVNLKLKAYYLYQAAKTPMSTKSALRNLEFYPKLAALYAINTREVQLKIANQFIDFMKVEPSKKFVLPIQGRNI